MFKKVISLLRGASFFQFTKFECPICLGRFRRFFPYGISPRQNALCPQCGSLERHRLLWLYLRNKTNFFSHSLRVLHFAPERVLNKIFGQCQNIDYVSADISSPLAKVKMDITDIAALDNSFDAILCIHVLEHVVEDQKAMRELFRVLKPGGWAILQVPVLREKTFEDPTVVLPEDRERIFGQKDHVRIYGRDYSERLEKAGFAVRVDSYSRSLGQSQVKKYCLFASEDTYFCTK